MSTGAESFGTEVKVKFEPAKRVITYDLNGKENGFLIELQKKDRFTTSYLTAALPGCFKGYHAHRVRASNYICIRGKIKVILITPNGKEEYILDSSKPTRFHISHMIPTAISNEWDEEGWLINFPNPPYDPELKNEQLDFTEAEAIRWMGELPRLRRRIERLDCSTCGGKGIVFDIEDEEDMVCPSCELRLSQ